MSIFKSTTTLSDLLITICNLKITSITLLSLSLLLLLLLSKSFDSAPRRRVYLVDFACYKPKDSQLVKNVDFLLALSYAQIASQETLGVTLKGAQTAGIGDTTYVPEVLQREPPDFSFEGGRVEAAAALYGAVDALLSKTGVKAEDIGVLIVSCDLFNPVPSLSSMIVNRYKLRDNVKCFNLSGMGCSAGLAAVGLAKDLLQVHENTCAMIVSTEVLSPYLYEGNDRSKMSGNIVFRVGGAAVLLSNRRLDHRASKYQLVHVVRTNTSSSASSYGCIFREEDELGFQGITITRHLLVEAGNAIKEHITTLGKLILPTSEKLAFGLNYIKGKLHLPKSKPYTPNFGRAIDHFIPHLGGKPVIDALEGILGLDMEAARMTLYRYGNTSSSSVWYELSYTEAKGRVEAGGRVWQLGFGSGFKCISVVWEALRSVDRSEKGNPWCNDIDNFPMELHFEPVPYDFVKQ